MEWFRDIGWLTFKSIPDLGEFCLSLHGSKASSCLPASCQRIPVCHARRAHAAEVVVLVVDVRVTGWGLARAENAGSDRRCNY